MGMAASQARYISLTARKTNTEYEGQQLNQERVVLGNRTADLFNQMLNTKVPTCPDSNDFTKIQYSWSDGYNTSVLSDYYQLSTAMEDYNYVVTNYHNEDVYTGTRKIMNDPKVVAERNVEYTYTDENNDNKKFVVEGIQYNKEDNTYIVSNEDGTKKVLEPAVDEYEDKYKLDAIYNRTYELYAPTFVIDSANKTYSYPYQKTDEDGNPMYDIIQVPVVDEDGNPVYDEDGNPKYTEEQVPVMDNHVYTEVDKTDELQLIKLRKTYTSEYDENKTYYYCAEINTYVVGDEVEERHDNEGFPAKMTARYGYNGENYYTDGERFLTEADILALDETNKELLLKLPLEDEMYYDFKYIGNCKLTELTEEDLKQEDVAAEIRQIRLDMADEEKGHKVAKQNFDNCFDPNTGEYLGGIYKFNYQGTVHYTTLDDLTASAASAFEDKAWELADNKIDFQLEKLPYYKAVYLNTRVEDTQKALLETDGKGRFTTMRLEDDSVAYTLNTETVTDEEAYQNAMNQYYYNQEKYDKTIRDINAKTELIQAEDRTLELRLKQLDTEQNALQTEMDAVKKIITKNVETSFKTFGGG